MDTSIWKESVTPGLRVMSPEAGLWSMSPDDQWIAYAEVLPDEAGQCALWCAEVETGRVVFEKRGRPVKAIGWASSEMLLAVREETRVRARVILYAVPDGGVLGSIPLESLPGSRCKVEFARGGVAVALVAPQQWTAMPREREPSRRLAYVLRTDPLEVVASYDPDETVALPRLPSVRMAVATLSPDGHRLIVWQSAPPDGAIMGTQAGSLLSHDWTRGRDLRVAVAGRLVHEVAWMGPDTLVMRSAVGSEPVQRGDVDVVEISRGEVLYSSVGEDPPDGWVGGRATIDVHPDRARLLVVGRVQKEGRVARDWNGVLREVTPATARATVPRGIATKLATAMGATWLPPEVGGIAVFRARTQREGEVARLPTIADDADGATRIVLPLEGRKPSWGRIARSPGGTALVAHWQVEPESGAHARKRLGAVTTRYLYGPVTATRLALIDPKVFR